MIATGLLYAVLSALANGTFGVLAKIDRVVKAEVEAYAFSVWAALGVAASSAVILVFLPWAWTPWALLSGALFVVSSTCAFGSLSMVGIAIASGIWCGTAVLVSFSWGLLVQHEAIAHQQEAVMGIVGILFGIVGMALAGQWSLDDDRQAEVDSSTLPEWDRRSSASLEPTPIATETAPDEQAELQSAPLLDGPEDRKPVADSRRFVAGAVLGLIAGSSGGLILAPMAYAPEDRRGLPYVPPMAIGVVLTAPTVALLLDLLGKGRLPQLKPRAAAVAGVLSGAIWNAGNVASIVAVPLLGLAIAYPIMQCGLLVAGVWGVLLFGEMTGRWRGLYWISGLILVVSAYFLAQSKD